MDRSRCSSVSGRRRPGASRVAGDVLRLVMVALVALALIVGWTGASAPQTKEPWPSVQGGPAHLGVRAGAPQPPLRLAWRAAGPAGALSGPAVGPGIVVATARTALVAIDPGTGRELWSVRRKLGQLVPPALAPEVGSGGVVVFVEGSTRSDGALVAVDLATRAQRWRTRLGGLSRSAPTLDGDAVFVGSEDGFLYSITLSTGKVRWRAKLDGFVDTSPAVADGRVFAVGEDRTTGRATFFALDAATGRRSWAPFVAPGFSIGASSPTVAGTTVYLGFGDLRVRAFDVATGAVRWDAPVRSDFSPHSVPAFSGSDLFIDDGTGGLYRFDGRTGDLRWEFQFASLFIWGSPLVVGDRVYAGTQDGTLAAVDAETGHRVWQRQVVGGPIGPLAPADGRLLVPLLGRGGGLVALEHDPNGVVGDAPSPTTLRPGIALADYAAASAAVLAGALLLRATVFRRGRDGQLTSPGPDEEAESDDGARVP